MSTPLPSTEVPARPAPPLPTGPAAVPGPNAGVWGVLALLVLGGLALLFRRPAPPSEAADAEGDPVPAAPSADSGHPGLSHDELLILLTAAAIEVIGTPVRIVRFRPLTPMDWTWAVQGRVDIHTSHHIR